MRPWLRRPAGACLGGRLLQGHARLLVRLLTIDGSPGREPRSTGTDKRRDQAAASGGVPRPLIPELQTPGSSTARDQTAVVLSSGAAEGIVQRGVDSSDIQRLRFQQVALRNCQPRSGGMRTMPRRATSDWWGRRRSHRIAENRTPSRGEPNPSRMPGTGRPKPEEYLGVFRRAFGRSVTPQAAGGGRRSRRAVFGDPVRSYGQSCSSAQVSV